jgi:hypothetical protein
MFFKLFLVKKYAVQHPKPFAETIAKKAPQIGLNLA